MAAFHVQWRLTDGRTFAIDTEADSPEEAAEAFFVICNGEAEGDDADRWRAMQHRSLSVGDNVNINGTPYHCESVGFRPSTEVDPKTMEERLGRPLDPGRELSGGSLGL